MLRVLRLSHSRYYAWKREGKCGLDDVASCPHLSPQQLTPTEFETIKEMVTSNEYRHVTTGTLAPHQPARELDRRWSNSKDIHFFGGELPSTLSLARAMRTSTPICIRSRLSTYRAAHPQKIGAPLVEDTKSAPLGSEVG